MVFPVETEERVKRRALSVCQDHLRKVLDVTRKVPQMVDFFIKNDKTSAQKLFAEIKVSEEEVDGARRMVSRELAEIGAILMSREDFLRFTNLTCRSCASRRTGRTAPLAPYSRSFSATRSAI